MDLPAFTDSGCLCRVDSWSNAPLINQVNVSGKPLGAHHGDCGGPGGLSILLLNRILWGGGETSLMMSTSLSLWCRSSTVTKATASTTLNSLKWSSTTWNSAPIYRRRLSRAKRSNNEQKHSRTQRVPPHRCATYDRDLCE